jgi:hypothetical protein
VWGDLRERDHMENLGVDGRVILKFILQDWSGELDLIGLAQDREILGLL